MPDIARTLNALNGRITNCQQCPRLVSWREQVAVEKRASFREDDYWGRPVPGFGDPEARLLIVGLAPAAHGANRTGRMFTGDRSGEWLYRALHRAGFCSQSEATGRGDGLTLTDAWITAAVHCAPPDNKPTPAERDSCQSWLLEEMTTLLPQLRVIVALGGFAWNQTLRVLKDCDLAVPRPRPKFSHLSEVRLAREGDAAIGTTEDSLMLLGSYHPSQQNTFTGRLTEKMFDEVWSRAGELAGR